MTTYNIYGGASNLNYDHCEISRETEKAVLLTTCSSEGSHLHEYEISFWLPKSVFYANQSTEVFGGVNVTLPHYFSVSINRRKIA